MRDLMFSIRAQDRTQSAFDSVERGAREMGIEVKRTQRDIMNTAAATDRMTAAVNRYGAATRAAASANDNWRRTNMTYQLFDIGQTAAMGMNPGMIAMQQGPQIVQMYAGQGGVKAALSDTWGTLTGLIGGFGKLGPAAIFGAAAASTAMLGMQSEINATSDVAVSFSDVFRANMQLAGGAMSEYLEPAFAAIAPWASSAWEMVKDGAIWVGNTIVRIINLAVDAMSTSIMALPDAFRLAGEAAANGFIGSIEWMVQKAIGGIDWVISKVNDLAKMAGREGDLLGSLGGDQFSLGRVDFGGDEASARLRERAAAFRDRQSSNWSRDYMGDWFDAVKEKSIINARDRLDEVAGSADKAGGAIRRAANDNVDPWSGLRDAIEPVNAGMQAMRDIAGGFMDDLRSGLKNGEGFWKSFGNAAMNVLDKITDRMINGVLDSIFAMGGAGGGAGGIFGAIGKLFGFAGGGYTGSVGRDTVAGVVHGGEYVFSASAVDRLGKDRLDMLHKGKTDPWADVNGEGGPEASVRLKVAA